MKTPLFLVLTGLITLLPFQVRADETVRVNANKMCSVVLKLPYASDNISDEEWEKFQQCLAFVKSFSE